MSDRTCPHGLAIGGTQLPDGGWCGGIGACRCCLQSFGYLNTSSWGSGGLITSSVQDDELCPPCGGTRTEYIHPDYERVELGGGVTTIRKRSKP